MTWSRRGVLTGAMAAIAMSAAAQTPDELSKYAAYKAWDPGQPDARAPMHAVLETGDGEITLGEWMDGRPAVIALWASWCGPCLVEKAGEALVAERLIKANARARILMIQAFDSMPLTEGRALLKRLGAGSIATTRATEVTEKLFTKHFGASTRTSQRPFMPSLMIAAADGRELARSNGVMPAVSLRHAYWYDDLTFEFLSNL